MASPLPPDLQALAQALEATTTDATQVVANLAERDGTWQPGPGMWSVAECLDHLATANRVYLVPMRAAAEAARARGRVRRGPATPGVIGRWFVRQLEPGEHTRKFSAPRASRPRPSPPLADAFAAFLQSQRDAHDFLHTYAAIDLTGVRFVNPFLPAVRFSLATGLHVIAAHNRRHLKQASRVREQLNATPR